MRKDNYMVSGARGQELGLWRDGSEQMAENNPGMDLRDLLSGETNARGNMRMML